MAVGGAGLRLEERMKKGLPDGWGALVTCQFYFCTLNVNFHSAVFPEYLPRLSPWFRFHFTPMPKHLQSLQKQKEDHRITAIFFSLIYFPTDSKNLSKAPVSVMLWLQPWFSRQT